MPPLKSAQNPMPPLCRPYAAPKIGQNPMQPTPKIFRRPDGRRFFTSICPNQYLFCFIFVLARRRRKKSGFFALLRQFSIDFGVGLRSFQKRKHKQSTKWWFHSVLPLHTSPLSANVSAPQDGNITWFRDGIGSAEGGMRRPQRKGEEDKMTKKGSEFGHEEDELTVAYIS